MDHEFMRRTSYQKKTGPTYNFANEILKSTPYLLCYLIFSAIRFIVPTFQHQAGENENEAVNEAFGVLGKTNLEYACPMKE
ncbi:hypothetical protein L2E82_13083 [Cichorium intybus]|uniref:Uncharacterized protein n=1 Tax=Cichorium intybus TaxID=13427 RepID=A0ACB9GIH4_CICIN|nr:hypothetical protein L2E82_13083 [Cichorium intybus]